MNARGDGLERRPARTAADVRVAAAVAKVVKELGRRFPGRHICADYHDPTFVIVNVVDPDGATLAQEWLAR